MPYKNHKDKKRYQAAYYPKWYAKNGRNRAVDYVEAIREWQINHPEAKQAGRLLCHALKTGKIIKPNECSRCGRVKRLSAHHDDYSKPLIVLWVCSSCHKQIHAT